MNKIIAPKRFSGIQTFDKKKLNDILDALNGDIELPPVECTSKDNKYELRDGFHRFYISQLIGYTDIPANIDKWFFFEVY